MRHVLPLELNHISCKALVSEQLTMNKPTLNRPKAATVRERPLTLQTQLPHGILH